ncbi:MAG: aminotransferase class V-fold PLP-dependent enzyme [Flavobacteriaceae bacterium]|nr:aminotransferase class V-fold PLP-dependent enzyme [Flavobacteriaceae bacterium]
MLANQSALFDLDPAATYLNGAYMSPQLRSVTNAGIRALERKARPNTIFGTDFFTDREVVKAEFAQLIDVADKDRTCIIPSVSYGLANAAQNIPLKSGDEIILIEEQFPSNVYTWQKVAKARGAHIKRISPPALQAGRAELWNQKLMEAISPRTVVVAAPLVHWADGTLFDLMAVREKLNALGGYLVLDGTQSIGAYPFSVTELQPDVVVCAGYKWLMGPYSLGVAYYNERFDKGDPIEDNWMNRLNSENFAGLTQYQDAYQPKAGRYTVGESSNFILIPMLSAALKQVNAWGVKSIQEYCSAITASPLQAIEDKGYFIERPSARAAHLFGLYVPEHKDLNLIKEELKKANISVSYRGEAIRVAPHVYNSEEDLNKLAGYL